MRPTPTQVRIAGDSTFAIADGDSAVLRAVVLDERGHAVHGTAIEWRSSDDGVIAVVAPPYVPFASAWQRAGVRLSQLQVVTADARNALWAAEQCLRSGACSAVLCWPQHADDRALRRLQVAAETGRCLGFAFRPASAARNPSPAALRIAVETHPAAQLRVIKSRGGLAPPRPIPFSVRASATHSA